MLSAEPAGLELDDHVDRPSMRQQNIEQGPTERLRDTLAEFGVDVLMRRRWSCALPVGNCFNVQGGR